MNGPEPRPTAPAAEPRVSVVIPSFSGARAASLQRLRTALASQTLVDHEVIVVEGVSPQGRAINLGVRRARAPILMVIDDDSEIRDPQLLAKLVRVLDEIPGVGMVGASLRTPEDATWFQRRAAREMPRFDVPVVHEVTDSDLPCHGCAAFPSSVFRAIGAEREEIVRGLDPDLRERLRAAGYRVVLAPDAIVFHPLPPTYAAFLRTMMRNGAGSAYAQHAHPELVVETHEGLGTHDFVPRRSFAYRLARFPVRVLWAALSLRPIRATGYLFYAVGFLVEWSRLKLTHP